jgi:hypothetical protein
MPFDTTKSSKPTKEYRIEGANDSDSLAAKVTKMLNEGWTLDGSLQVVCPIVNGAPAAAFYQALVR